MTLDHKGQKLKDKFFDNLIYQDNPLRREKEEDYEDIHKINAELEKLKTKRDFIQLSKSELAEDNRQLTGIIKEFQVELKILKAKTKSLIKSKASKAEEGQIKADESPKKGVGNFFKALLGVKAGQSAANKDVDKVEVNLKKKTSKVSIAKKPLVNKFRFRENDDTSSESDDY